MSLKKIIIIRHGERRDGDGEELSMVGISQMQNAASDLRAEDPEASFYVSSSMAPWTAESARVVTEILRVEEEPKPDATFGDSQGDNWDPDNMLGFLVARDEDVAVVVLHQASSAGLAAKLISRFCGVDLKERECELEPGARIDIDVEGRAFKQHAPI